MAPSSCPAWEQSQMGNVCAKKRNTHTHKPFECLSWSQGPEQLGDMPYSWGSIIKLLNYLNGSTWLDTTQSHPLKMTEFSEWILFLMGLTLWHGWHLFFSAHTLLSILPAGLASCIWPWANECMSYPNLNPKLYNAVLLMILPSGPCVWAITPGAIVSDVSSASWRLALWEPHFRIISIMKLISLSSHFALI